MEPVVSVLGVPGYDRCVINRHRQERHDPRLEGGICRTRRNCDRGPPVARRTGVPPDYLVKGRSIASACFNLKLRYLLPRRCFVGWRREAQLVAGGEDPGLPVTCIGLDLSRADRTPQAEKERKNPAHQPCS